MSKSFIASSLLKSLVAALLDGLVASLLESFFASLTLLNLIHYICVAKFEKYTAARSYNMIFVKDKMLPSIWREKVTGCEVTLSK